MCYIWCISTNLSSVCKQQVVRKEIVWSTNLKYYENDSELSHHYTHSTLHSFVTHYSELSESHTDIFYLSVRFDIFFQKWHEHQSWHTIHLFYNYLFECYIVVKWCVYMGKLTNVVKLSFIEFSFNQMIKNIITDYLKCLYIQINESDEVLM